MNIETGEIKYHNDLTTVSDTEVLISADVMTKTQKTNLQVSKHDNKSYLGHLFNEHRKEAGTRVNRTAEKTAKVKAKRKAASKARKKNRK